MTTATKAPPLRRWHYDIEQGSPEWADLRLGIITASAIGGLLTGSGAIANNATSRGLYHRLLAERITGEADDSFSNMHTMRGHLLEPYARELYARDHAHDAVSECGFVTSVIEGVTLGYSPDGLVGSDGLIEIKSRLAKHQLALLLSPSEPVPSEYMAQLQAGMLITGRQWCDFVSYSPGLPLYVYRVTPDPGMVTTMIQAAKVTESWISDGWERYQRLLEQSPATPKVNIDQEIIL